MIARLRQFVSALGELFWLLPAGMVLAGVLGAFVSVHLDREGYVPDWLVQSAWLYNGGGTGARTLLGTVASSTIGVAGTVFSITIAALSLAAGQMGPRLLRNFTRDRGNQFTLGAFLGTFSFTLMVLRTVRTKDEGDFIPHLSLTISIALAFVCVAVLVFFVGHMAGRINVDVVINLVSEDVSSAITRLLSKAPGDEPPPKTYWRNAYPVMDGRHGYLQQLDYDGLADWAAEHGTCVRLLVRPGSYIFPGAPIALLTVPADGAQDAINDALAIGSQRTSTADLEFSVRSLVEVAVRALSPGINDPHTAMSALDRLASTLCEVVPLHLPTGVVMRDGQFALVYPGYSYDGLTDAMFHEIRQNALSSAAVLIRMLDVLASVLSAEHDPARRDTLQRHADLVLADAEREIANPSDLADIRKRYKAFNALRQRGVQAFSAEIDD